MGPLTPTLRNFLLLGLAAAIGLVRLCGAAASAPVPEISLSIRGLNGGSIEKGVPIFIAVRLDAPRGIKAPLVVAPAAGTWADAVLVELVGPDDGVGARAGGLTSFDDPAATLDGDRYAVGMWLFRPEATLQLAPGKYEVRARLKLTSGRGWTGETEVATGRVQLVAQSENAERKIQRTMANAQLAIAENRMEEAAEILDRVLTTEPDVRALLKLRALVCMYGGDMVSAQDCLRRVRILEAQGEGHPSVELHELTRMIDEAAASTDQPVSRQPWAKPPARVLEPLYFPNREYEVAGGASNQAPAAAPQPPAPAPTVSTPSQPAQATAPVPVAPKVSTRVASPVPTVVSPGPASGTVVPAAELVESKILVDLNGQWAASAKAGSQYSSPNYGAEKLVGPPDVPSPGDNINAWCHASGSATSDWIELTFAHPVHATEVRVRQTNCPGTIAKIEAFSPDGTVHLWWEGADTFRATYHNTLAWFAVRVPRTDYVVVKVKITLNLAAVSGWKQIDAVQLVGAP